jgi:hypothetical protein
VEGLVEGRIVHYTAYNGRCLAGMIIGVSNDNEKADLVIFTNMPNTNRIKNFGIQFHQDIEHSGNIIPNKIGTWHWPERS